MWKQAFALTLLTAFPIAGFACTASWVGTSPTGNWSNINNWSTSPFCIPGETSPGDVDLATFPTIGSQHSITVTQDSTMGVGLNQLTFNSPVGSTSYTITYTATTGYIQFNGASPQLQVIAGIHVISAHIQANGSSALDISVIVPAGMLTIEQGLQNPGGQDVTFSGPGQLTFQWNGLNSVDDYNEFTIAPGNLNITSGTFLNSNNLSIPVGGDALGTEILSNNLIISGGSVMVSNTGTITGNAVGSSISCATGMSVSGGNVVVMNSGTVTGTMGSGVGSRIDMPMNCDISGGATVLVSNAGAIQNTGGGQGSYISVVQNLNINNGTVTVQNTGPVGPNCYGSAIYAGAGITITQGSLFNLNTGPVTGDGVGSTVNAAAINVAAAGTMAGNGIFQSFMGGATTQITNGGTVIAGGQAVGSSPGSMLIRGSYTQTSAGNLVINLGNPSSFSQLNITGTAQLAGSLELALSSGASIAGGTYKILTADGGVSGTFANIIKFNLGNLMPQLQYFPTYVLLSFIESLIGPMTQASYINYAESLFSSVNHINLRLDRQMAQLRNRFTGPSVRFESIAALSEELLVDNSPDLNPQVEEKQEQMEERISYCSDQPWNVYFGPTGNVGRVLTKHGTNGFHYDTVGALAGFDYAYSDFGIGFLADYDHIDGRAAHKWGKFTVDQAHGSLYATYIRRAEQQLAFNLILGGGYEWYTVRRNTAGGVAQGTPQGVEFDALAGMEYTFEKKEYCGMPEHLQVVPLVNLQYIYLHVNNYREHGAGLFDLQYESQNVRSLRSTLGTRINYSWEWTNVVFTPEVNVAWQWEYFDKNRHIGASAAGLATTLAILQPGRNVALAGIDFLVTFFDRYGLEASYDFEWNTLYMDHFFYLGCNFKF